MRHGIAKRRRIWNENRIWKKNRTWKNNRTWNRIWKKRAAGLLLLGIGCSAMIESGVFTAKNLGEVLFQKIYLAAAQTSMPALEQKEENQEIGSYFWNWIGASFASIQFWKEAESGSEYETQVESLLDYKKVLAREATDENYIDEKTGELVGGQSGQEEAKAAEENGIDPAGEEVPVENTESQDLASSAASIPASAKVMEYPLEKLADFDYLLQNFYRVDQTTTIDSSQLNAQAMLNESMKLKAPTGNPQVLIYHTHSQEAYADATDESGSVLGMGEYLAQILRDTYGINVLHHMGKYDVESRDNAYTKAAVGLEQVLAENPDIEVVIDLHRDGVAETTHLVTEVNGKPTAQIMFFNGLSRTTAGAISYLPNENLGSNLAFSFQMQLTAKEYYPDFSRAVYLKGYRYNMHYCPHSLLVEVGAQNNTVEEARNAMEPLADILAKVILE